MRERRTVDALVFALVVDVVEVAKDLDRGEVRAGLVDHTLRAVLHNVFEELERLVDLAPVTSLLLHEPPEDGRHDLVKVVAGSGHDYTLVVRAG